MRSKSVRDVMSWKTDSLWRKVVSWYLQHLSRWLPTASQGFSATTIVVEENDNNLELNIVQLADGWMCYEDTFLMIEIASEERNLGYRTSSLTIESNTSSSSSPGNGDCRGQSTKRPFWTLSIEFKHVPITTIVKINVTSQKCYWLKLTNNSYLSN